MSPRLSRPAVIVSTTGLALIISGNFVSSRYFAGPARPYWPWRHALRPRGNLSRGTARRSRSFRSLGWRNTTPDLQLFQWLR
jgi:hypothetical protein